MKNNRKNDFPTHTNESHCTNCDRTNDNHDGTIKDGCILFRNSEEPVSSYRWRSERAKLEESARQKQIDDHAATFGLKTTLEIVARADEWEKLLEAGRHIRCLDCEHPRHSVYGCNSPTSGLESKRCGCTTREKLPEINNSSRTMEEVYKSLEGEIDFGVHIAAYRSRLRLTLRKFAEMANMDAGNLSRIERGKVSPPQEPEVLNRMAYALGLVPGTLYYQAFINAAHFSNGRLPPDILSDAEVMAKMPLFLCGLRSPMTQEKMEKLMTIIRTS